MSGGGWNCSVCTLLNVAEHDTCVACLSPSSGEWTCLICSLNNAAYLIECEACTTPREKPGKVVAEVEWICGVCTFSNENFSKKCSMCDSEQQIVITNQETIPNSTPKSCNNTPTVNNIEMADDDEEDKENDTKRKLRQQKEKEKEDERMDYDSAESDIEDNEEIEEDEEGVDEYEYAFNFEAINDAEYSVMIKNPAEIDEKKSFLPPVYEIQALSVLNEMQTKALQLTVEKSKEQSLAAHSSLLQRVLRLGFTNSQLEDTLRYVRDSAPVIIHVYLDRFLDLLLEDTHYRNQFETNRSGGTLCHESRKEWENRIFHNIYSNSSAFDRVKYGVLSDPQGVRACHRPYGDSYPSHLYTDVELKEVMDVATDPQGMMFKSSQSSSTYKEIQIHGPVALNKHVEAIVVNPRLRNDSRVQKLLVKFAEQNHCNILWMDEV